MILKQENAIIDLKNKAIKEYGGVKFTEIAFAQKINIRGDSNNKAFILPKLHYYQIVVANCVFIQRCLEYN